MKQLNVFLKELESLFIKYNISISHEDQHGAFILEKYKQSNLEWLNQAMISEELQSYQEAKYGKIVLTRANLSKFEKIHNNTNFIQFCNGPRILTVHRNYVVTIFKEGILAKSNHLALKFRYKNLAKIKVETIKSFFGSLSNDISLKQSREERLSKHEAMD